MSLVSSVLSSRRHRPSTSSGWRINIRLAPLMDSLAALASGLLLRFCIDTVGRYDFKLTGTLVGLWEGVVLLHFLKKAPRSSDPYIGFGLRLFVDFMFTESVARLVLVCIWTALGMVLADIVPAVWDESGLRRVWREVRRDLYRLSEMVPTVAFFPPARTVRFSPSRVPSSVITEEEAPTEPLDTTSIPDPSISVLTTDHTQTHSPAPLSSTIEPVSTTTVPVAQEILRRRVPGHFPSGYSDTDTEIGSPRGPASRSRSAGRTARRLSVYPGHVDLDTSSELSSTGAPEDELDDLDDANRSSLSGSTERGEADTTLNLNIEEVPEMPVEEQEALLVDTAAAAAQGKHEPEEGELTPKQRSVPFYMPPTPSDSAARVHRNRRILEDRDKEDKEQISLPPSDQLPQIPDFLEESNTEDWEKIQKEEVDAERPPTPPEKDRPVSSAPANNAGNTNTTLPVPPPKQQTQTQTPSPDTTANPANANDDTNDPDNDGWDTLDSQFLSGPGPTNPTNPFNATTHTTNDHTHTQPPPAYQSFDYDETNYDDIYDDPPAAAGGQGGQGGQASSFDPEKETFDLFGPGPGGEGGAGAGASKNPWEAEALRQAEAQRQAEAEAAAEAQRQAEAEAAAEAQRQAEAEAEAEAQRIADEAKRKIEEEEAAAAEALKLKKAEETAERKRKEAADEAARQKKRLEEEERERKKREEEERRWREEEEERKKQEEEERKRVKEERKRQKEEKRLRLEEEARQEEERKRQEEERLRLEEERQRQEEEERKRQEQAAAEEEERKRQEKEEADRKEREAREAAEAEAEDRRAKEARQLEEQEQARLQAQREEAERQQQAADEAAAAQPQPQPQEGAAQFESEQQEGEDEGEPAQVAAHPPPTTESANPLQTAEADNAPTEQPNGAGESSQPPAGPDAAEPVSAPAPAPVPEHQGAADADAEQQPPVADADAEQHPTEHPSEPAFDPHEVESVITEASQVPDKVAERLSNIILLKAQMAEVEEQIGELRRELEGAGEAEAVEAEEKARLEAELRVKEKILRKMQRKELRRRDGMPIAMFADGDNDSSTDKLTPRDAEIKIEEKLEQLLAPGVKSIRYWINVPTGPLGKKQMPKVSALLDRFRLLDYTIADSNNARSMTIEVPEAKFNDWLTAYRISVTQVDDGSD